MTDTFQNQSTPSGFMRLKQVLNLIPVSKSTWLAGVKSGRFPKPVKLSPGVTVWKTEDIHACINSFKQS